MLRNEVLKKLSMNNPAGESLSAMSIDELSRVNGGGDVGAETTFFTPSSAPCIGLGVRMSSQQCAYVGGTAVSYVLSRSKC